MSKPTSSDSDAPVEKPSVAPSADGEIVLARQVLPDRIPLVPLPNRPFFPRMLVPMMIEDAETRRVFVEQAESSAKVVGLVLQRPGDAAGAASPASKSARLFRVGVVAEIAQIQPHAEGPLPVMLAMIERFEIAEILAEEPRLLARVRYISEAPAEHSDELKAYALALIQSIKELIQLNPLHKEELSLFMSRSPLNEPGRLADFAAAMTTATGSELQEVLETFSIRARIERVLLLLKKELDITRLQAQISKQIEEKISKRQREFFLQEQLKTIKKELGLTKEGPQAEYERFAGRLKALTLPDEARERIDEEMDKLKLLEPSSPEFNVTRTYLDWLTSLPWGVPSPDRYDLAHASRVLDRDHYGLDDVKERILEFLSVGIMKGNIAGSILCFVGPPGVGKTSVGRSIASSIGRPFYRFSLGGMRDEAEIKGHRRTYIGALPGKFIQAIKVCKSSNPVIMLDEVDKIGASYQGDPASALLEVLDPEQNRDFLDHYLDVRFDLSNVLFICTANILDSIPRPLLDRMEVIKLAGYIREEKIRIARDFLIPKQMKANGIKPRTVTLTGAALREIIDGYAREPGVRDLENHIKRILRKSVRSLVEGKAKSLTVDAADVRRLLGRRPFTDDNPFRRPQVGIAMGLAWTSLGGDVLPVEATQVASDKGGFKQTGQLGNVMVESSEIAYTHVRSKLGGSGAAGSFFDRHFVHLHVPAGATPKDGPSAGITMATALYSLATRRPPARAVAMTGELTLTGLVMPIGGVKEKMIAAKRAGLSDVILPAENRKDFEELPVSVRRGMHPQYVRTFGDVVRAVFGRPAGARRRA